MYKSSTLQVLQWQRPRKIVILDSKPLIKGRFEKLTGDGQSLGIRIQLTFNQPTLTEPILFQCTQDFFFETLGITNAETIIRSFYWSVIQALKQRLQLHGKKVRLPKRLPLLEFSPGEMNNVFSGPTTVILPRT